VSESDDGDLGGVILSSVGKVFYRLVPTGWFDQNKLSLGRMFVNHVRPSVEPEQQLVHPKVSQQSQELIEALRPTPYEFFSQMLLPALTQSSRKTAIAQSYANMARIAITLERHHLAHASYPETLDALVPQFISKLPHDVINGQPLKYRRTETGGFVLYSVGWNEKDDGGTVVMTSGKTPSVDQTQGDWVWASEAK
jgi:Tfp pilus assembly protein PilE